MLRLLAVGRLTALSLAVVSSFGCGKTVDASEVPPGDHPDASETDSGGDAASPVADAPSAHEGAPAQDGARDVSSSDAIDAPTALDAAADSPPVTCPEIVGAGSALALTNSEYDHTVRDLLGDASSPATAFVPDEIGPGFKVNLARNVSDLRRQQYAMAADQLAQAALGRIDSLLPCNPAAGEATCANQFIATFGPRAFRRPLLPNETSDLAAVYQSARMSQDFAHAISAVIAAMLKSPHFYEIDEGSSSDAQPLGPYQMASRLSYFIYRSMPDRPLFDAAASGKLASAADVETQTRRMLADPKAHDGVVEFFAEWLSLDRLATTTKDPSVSPDFATLRGYMRTETTKFVETVFFGTGRWTDLFVSTDTWLNEPLARLYGVGGVTGVDFRKASLDAKMRGGLLTQASFLSIAALADQSSPTLRGRGVLQKVLCQEIPPPPPMFPPLPALMPGQTNRQRYEMVGSGAVCAACHSLMDGIGFGFESFDAIGRFRTIDNGGVVDSSGVVRGTDADGPFVGAIELSSKIAASHDAKLCAAKQWLRFGLGRWESEGDACSLERAAATLIGKDDMSELVVSLATSDAFRYARWLP